MIKPQTSVRQKSAVKVREPETGAGTSRVFHPPSKLMHRICGTPVVKRAHYGNLMPLVFYSHSAGILRLFWAGDVKQADGQWQGFQGERHHFRSVKGSFGSAAGLESSKKR